MNKNTHTFIAADANYDEADIVIFGAPFDGTTSFRPGTRFAPASIRNEAYGIETYSPYQNKDLTDLSICDIGDVEFPFGNTEKVLEEIYNTTSKILEDDKIPCMIGGEHLVTLGSVRAIFEKYPDIHIVHFDAHADLRYDYLGEKLSHSTVMRRIWELIGDKRIYQYGIRSGEKYEFEFAKNHTKLSLFGLEGFEEMVEKLAGKPVYLSVDLDVLDPAEFPGTGTPEAGGLKFNEFVQALKKLNATNIVGCDINELCPVLDNSGISTAAACKTLREVLLLLNSKK